MLVSQPSLGLPLQSAKLAAQPEMTQTEDWQATAAVFTLGSAWQLVRQLPQRVTVDDKDTSQPLAYEPSQSPKVALHVATEHVPATQEYVAA